MPIALILACVTESLTENVKLGCEPLPEPGETPSAVGAPPVTCQVPTARQPEFTVASAAYRKMVFWPAQLAEKLRSSVTTTELVPMTTVEFVPRNWHWLLETVMFWP